MEQQADLRALSGIPRDEDGPVFSAPWQAAAFALAVRLSGDGRFTWEEWAATLSEEIHAAQQQGDPDLGDTYYEHWVRALERLCVGKGLLTEEGVADRQDAWRQAYLNTPHGQPVELSAAERSGSGSGE